MSRARRLFLGCLLSSCALASGVACTVVPDGEGDGSRSGDGGEETTIRVTRETHRVSPACRPRPIAQLVVRFFDALESGDAAAIRANFPSRGFQRYAVQGARQSPTTSELPRLQAYFAARHHAGERLTLVALRVNYAERQSDFGGTPIQPEAIAAVELDLLRAADDVADGEAVAYRAKAFIGCTSRKIFQWSMGPRDPGYQALCPSTAGPDGRVVLACA